MHIIFIPSAYPTKEKPLSSIFFKEQAIELSRHGERVGVIFSETRPITNINIKNIIKNRFQISSYNEDGIITFRMHGWNIFTMRNSIGINLWVKQQLRLFRKYIKKEGIPDIVHAHNALYGGVVAKKIKDKYGIPYVLTEHSSQILNNRVKEYEFKYLKDVYDNCDFLISVSNKLKSSMYTYTSKYIEVVPNIVNIELFKPIKNRHDKNIVFISVSNLKKDKGVHLSIKAFNEIRKNNDNIKLKIIGEGEYKKQLKNLVDELELNEDIEFLGAINREELPNKFAEADIFILPSKYETFGIAYIEALACGLPIIVTKCGGPEDFFCEEIGCMVTINNIDEIKIAMEKVILNIDKFNKDKLAQYIEDKFGSEVIIKKLIGIYKSILIK